MVDRTNSITYHVIMNKIRKIIFLDIDGVLNNYYHGTKDWVGWKQGKHAERGYSMDPNNVKWLNRIIKLTGALVVCSSTWRSDMKNVRDTLKKNGFKGNVIDRTPYLENRDDTFRGNEIYKWLDTFKKRKYTYDTKIPYIILDDDSDMLLWQKDHYIRVSGITGLSFIHFVKAVWMLNRPFILQTKLRIFNFKTKYAIFNIWHSTYLVVNGMFDELVRQCSASIERKRRNKYESK